MVSRRQPEISAEQIRCVKGQIEYSANTEASVNCAWAYMSSVANWDDPPAQFRLDGPFVNGSRGTTEIPGQPTRHWQLKEVKPAESYTIDCPFDGAVISFEWRFTSLPNGRTMLRQRITLKGENASSYLDDVQRAFRSNLAPSMNRIAEAIGQACASGQIAGQE